MRNAMLFMALALLMAGCAAPPAPATAQATTKPLVLTTNTPEPTTTVTTTPSPIPPPTLAYTPTPADTPLATATLFFFSLPSPTFSAQKEFDCKLILQSVEDGTEFNANERFTVGWKVQNTGSASWYPASVTFTYAGGTKMFVYPVARLTQTVAPGDIAYLTADMRAPKNSTTYTTAWSLRQGTTFFCRVRVTIWVKE